MKNKILFLLFLFAFSPQGFSKEVLTGPASWYDSKSACKFNKDPKCPMANGESIYAAEKKGQRFGAMWGLPIGSRVRVCNPNNGRCADVKILDRGPARKLQRVIDLSRNSFAAIGEIEKGVIPVTVERI